MWELGWDGEKHLDYGVRQIWNLVFVAYYFSTLNIIFLIYIMVSIIHFPKILVKIKWDVIQSLSSNRVLKWTKVLVTQSCPTHCGSIRLLGPWDVPGKNTGVGCHSLLQGIFWTQGSNSGLLHCKQILYHLSHQGAQHSSLKSYCVMHVC